MDVPVGPPTLFFPTLSLRKRKRNGRGCVRKPSGRQPRSVDTSQALSPRKDSAIPNSRLALQVLFSAKMNGWVLGLSSSGEMLEGLSGHPPTPATSSALHVRLDSGAHPKCEFGTRCP